MIAVAVVSILAAIGYPSYVSQMRKGRRADAQSFAMDVVARQQQFLLDRRTYATSVSDAAADNGLAMAIPVAVSAYYTVTMATNTVAPPTFDISLTPIGTQGGDACGTLRINQAGIKSATGTGKCW